MTPSDLSYSVSDRGFRHYEAIPTTYGEAIHVYESSAASEPCLWVNVAPGLRHVGAAHLTLDQARRLRDTLDAAIAGHYQTRDS